MKKEAKKKEVVVVVLLVALVRARGTVRQSARQGEAARAHSPGGKQTVSSWPYSGLFLLVSLSMSLDAVIGNFGESRLGSVKFVELKTIRAFQIDCQDSWDQAPREVWGRGQVWGPSLGLEEWIWLVEKGITWGTQFGSGVWEWSLGVDLGTGLSRW